MTISVVVPCYNEEATVEAFYAEAERVREADFSGIADFEYIFVDDGSRDRTLELVKAMAGRDPAVHYISFSRNFGKEAAILAGLRAATGEMVTLMDADLQDPPALLRTMYDAIVNEGYDQVGTRRTTRKGEPILRSLGARAFYKIIDSMSDVEMVSGARDYRLMKRCVVDAILSLPEKCRYSKGIFSFVGFRTKWLPYENIERVAGQTKWSFRKLVRYAAEGITAFTTAPLTISLWTGLFFLAAAIACLVPALIVDSFRSAIVLTIVAVGLFVCGVLLTGLGVIGKYLAQAFSEIKDRPIYLIRETNCRGKD